MIYKVVFLNGQIDHCTAKSQLDLLKGYYNEQDVTPDEIKSINKISTAKAKKTMVTNTEYDEENPDDMPKEFCLLDMVECDDFQVIASTEF